MNGWMGTILRIDLTNRRILKEPLEEKIAYKYVGGRGLNIKILYDETKPSIHPLGPDNKLILGAGPCNGTLVPGNSRLTISAKSPVTGFLGYSSSGGSFGVKMKYAGYDIIIIEGEAKEPVYLWIEDDNIEVREARHLWGKTSLEVVRIIQREVSHPDIAVITIGPAGENLVRFASITSDLGRSHGKTGMGAVMGSKKLKAIAVRGTQGVKVARSDSLRGVYNELVQEWYDNEEITKKMANFGPSSALQPENEIFGSMPVKNYREGCWDKAWLLYGDHLKEKYYLKPKACFSCPIPCDRVYTITEGQFAGTWGSGLYNMQQYLLGTNIGVTNPDIMLRASALCDLYGMDVSMIGAIIAWAMECFEKKILTEGDTGGLKLEWGNSNTVLSLIHIIAYRRGIGDLFAEGIKIASEKIGKGAEKYAMHVKGLAIDTDDPRAHKSWALGCAVASRGAEHCAGMSMSELGFGGWDHIRGECWDGNKVDPFTEKNKGTLYKWLEDVRAFQHSMQVCQFVYSHVFTPKIGQPAMAARTYNAVTGLNLTAKDILCIGERIVNLEKAFNIREGWSRKDDTLPDRFLNETLPAGGAQGQIVHLEPMISEYYQERSWNKYGLPKKKKLIDLGLEEIANDLKQNS